MPHRYPLAITIGIGVGRFPGQSPAEVPGRGRSLFAQAERAQRAGTGPRAVRERPELPPGLMSPWPSVPG
eukprot:5983739-Pyramimonas_sp.AAC.1